MNPCPHCSRMTEGTKIGAVVHSTCPACTAIALKADGHRDLAADVPQVKREEHRAAAGGRRKKAVK